MCRFSYEELRLIRWAIETEILRREDLPNANKERTKQFEDLHDKVYGLIQDMKTQKEEI